MSFFDSESKSEYSLVPEGKYKASLFNVTCDLTSLEARLSVQYKLENNRRLFQNFKITDAGKKWLTWQMGTLGLSSVAKNLVEKPESATPAEIAKSYVDASKNYIGKVVELEVNHSEYNGKTREQVKVDTGFQDVAPKMDADDEIPF